MKLALYVDEAHGRQTELAQAIGCQPQLVWQWSRGVRTVPLDRCAAIEAATGGAVRRWDLRPEDWHRVWPELVGLDGAPPLVSSEPRASDVATPGPRKSGEHAAAGAEVFRIYTGPERRERDDKFIPPVLRRSSDKPTTSRER